MFSIYGFASTLYSGSYESWIVDLTRKKDKKLTKEFFIKGRALVAIALVFSGFIGALLVKSFGLLIIWPISATTYAITMLCLIFGEETRIKNKLKFSSALKSTSKQTKQGIFFTLKNKTIMLLIIISFIGGIATHFIGNMSWVSLLKEFSFPDYAFGYLWSFLSFLGIFSSFALKFVPNKKKEIR